MSWKTLNINPINLAYCVILSLQLYYLCMFFVKMQSKQKVSIQRHKDSVCIDKYFIEKRRRKRSLKFTTPVVVPMLMKLSALRWKSINFSQEMKIMQLSISFSFLLMWLINFTFHEKHSLLLLFCFIMVLGFLYIDFFFFFIFFLLFFCRRFCFHECCRYTVHSWVIISPCFFGVDEDDDDGATAAASATVAS